MDDDFFAHVGHDLRGELATMMAGVHYVLRYEKDVGAGSRDMLERVRGAGERLKRLLEEFDNAVWLRPDANRPLSLAPYDASELARRAMGQLAGAAAARGVDVSLETEARGDALLLEGDSELLRLALEYVLGFAITRSRDQPVQMRVTALGGAPVVEVIDEAGAVPPELLAQLLDPFEERAAVPADPVAPRRRERLGLGLAIARGIFYAHGGDLTVALSPGRGEGAGEGTDAQAGRGLRFLCRLAPTDEASSPGFV